MKTALTQESITPLLQSLQHSNVEFSRLYPGDSPARQPVHTVYGGAQIFKADTTNKLGAAALHALEEYAPTPTVFAKALGLKGSVSEQKILYNRVVEKLKAEPVEDFRIDFEDGY